MRLAIRFTLGAILMAAAVLKVSGSDRSAYAGYGWLSTDEVQWLAVIWETCLSIWLFSGLFCNAAWICVTFTFVLFAGISGHLGWVGQASCGCFGKVQASPWLAFGIDVGALILLITWWPKEAGLSALRQMIVRFGPYAMVIIVLLGLLWLLGIAHYGSTWAALAYLRGEELTVSPEFVDCGEGEVGQRLEAGVEISNWSDRPLRIIGGTSDCTCLATSGLPITVLPGSKQTVPLLLIVPKSDGGVYARGIEILTDSNRQPKLRLLVGCRIKPIGDGPR